MAALVTVGSLVLDRIQRVKKGVWFMSGKDRCHVRDGRGFRCTVEGDHVEIVNSKGQRAISHETRTSMWSVPINDLVVATATPRPEALRTMLERAGEKLPIPEELQEYADRAGYRNG